MAGGIRKGAGRKSKVDEQKLIKALTPIMPLAYKALLKGIKENQSWAVKLAMEYYFGKPRQQLDVTSAGKELNINPITWITTVEDK